jgi:hypothetical protein
MGMGPHSRRQKAFIKRSLNGFLSVALLYQFVEVISFTRNCSLTILCHITVVRIRELYLCQNTTITAHKERIKSIANNIIHCCLRFDPCIINLAPVLKAYACSDMLDPLLLDSEFLYNDMISTCWNILTDLSPTITTLSPMRR